MAKPGTPQQDPKKPTGETHAPKGAPAPGTAPHSAPVAKGNVGQKVGCLAVGCKDKDTRASFCEEHFKQYKFGLVSKSGERVLDYERKFEHYQKWVKAQKVA